jgi:hypothetical protein
VSFVDIDDMSPSEEEDAAQLALHGIPSVNQQNKVRFKFTLVASVSDIM